MKPIEQIASGEIIFVSDNTLSDLRCGIMDSSSSKTSLYRNACAVIPIGHRSKAEAKIVLAAIIQHHLAPAIPSSPSDPKMAGSNTEEHQKAPPDGAKETTDYSRMASSNPHDHGMVVDAPVPGVPGMASWRLRTNDEWCDLRDRLTAENATLELQRNALRRENERLSEVRTAAMLELNKGLDARHEALCVEAVAERDQLRATLAKTQAQLNEALKRIESLQKP